MTTLVVGTVNPAAAQPKLHSEQPPATIHLRIIFLEVGHNSKVTCAKCLMVGAIKYSVLHSIFLSFMVRFRLYRS